MRPLLTVSLIALGTAAFAECPAITVADTQGLEGAYPKQFELGAFEAAANCDLSFSENPAIAELNARIVGNPELPSVADRLPQEPLVVLPFASVGKYGGVIDGYSNATESGTSDLLSLRHASLTRFDSDLLTVKPNVAKSFEWNDDFTAITFTLRKGHKWSDGAPFTSADVEFWLENMTKDENVVGSIKDVWQAGGEPMGIEIIDEQTFKFTFAAPNPGFLAAISQYYGQPFQPKHFLGQYHPAINQDADKLAKEAGFENGYEVIAFYYGGSDWKDVPSPYLKDASKIASLPAAVVPTLESHIVVEDTTETRRVVANPYYHVVDTAGQQLPYVNEIYEQYIPDAEVRLLKLLNGEADYKSQSNLLPQAPALLDGQDGGNYTVILRPQITFETFGFNHTHEDEEKRAVFASQDFNLAMSHAINRDELNELAQLGLGKPSQYISFDPAPEFATEEQINFATQFDPAKASELLDGLGLADTDGDGYRELPSGAKLTVNIQFSTQGTSVETVEAVAQYWSDAGIQTAIKEVTSDEYRAAQSANELDVTVWRNGRPAATMQGNIDRLVVPFGSFFHQRNGMLWERYETTNGAEGVEPPAWVAELAELAREWQATTPGSDAYNELGSKIIDLQLANMQYIGTVQTQNLVYRSNKLKNFDEFKTWSYDYYRAHPYHPDQWWLDE
ncbi:ABC transporter substrate-binding protein [Shimia marina]|uniref:Putative ABC transporter-binding protein n=1 Tax=Shimia marina TaxID=321267 RepID=A0A0P1EQK6_9RHOB|nr:ABC transporter substrate-binding protein [Shimia marina]CUH52186.1 putative ABC transporter-binding protein precursor [Shimia marina]SFE72070.1 peptide/nickel transport system substrate-binding protein [Shimia marina]